MSARLCISTKTRPFGFVKRSNRVVPKAGGGIVPDFLSAYSTYVCKNPECVTSMILPPVYEQLFIMQQMFDLTTKVDISGLEGPFMALTKSCLGRARCVLLMRSSWTMCATSRPGRILSCSRRNANIAPSGLKKT